MSHLTSAASAEYFTPLDLIERVREFFGGRIDLDPASCAEANVRVKATTYYAAPGETRPWHGAVWCNPPGGLSATNASVAGSFLEAAIRKHRHRQFSECLLLLRACFNAKWFRPCLQYPFGVVNYALSFSSPAPPSERELSPPAAAGRSPHSYVLVYFGDRPADFAASFSEILLIPGVTMWAPKSPAPAPTYPPRA